jgi:hypothetical protein
MKRDQLARIEQGQVVQTMVLIFIAAQFAPASTWSTGDVLFTLIAGALVVLAGWLAWKLLRSAWRVVAGGLS